MTFLISVLGGFKCVSSEYKNGSIRCTYYVFKLHVLRELGRCYTTKPEHLVVGSVCVFAWPNGLFAAPHGPGIN